MEENRTTISSDDAALLIQKWYRNKRVLEYQAWNDNMEPEIVVPSNEEIATCAIEENVDEDEDSVGCANGMERTLAMGAVKLGIAFAITKVGTLVLNSVSAPVDQDDVAAAVIISKGSEAQ